MSDDWTPKKVITHVEVPPETFDALVREAQRRRRESNYEDTVTFGDIINDLVEQFL